MPNGWAAREAGKLMHARTFANRTHDCNGVCRDLLQIYGARSAIIDHESQVWLAHIMQLFAGVWQQQQTHLGDCPPYGCPVIKGHLDSCVTLLQALGHQLQQRITSDA